MEGLYLELNFIKNKWLLIFFYNTNRKNAFNQMEELRNFDLHAAYSDNTIFIVDLEIRANHRTFRWFRYTKKSNLIYHIRFKNLEKSFLDWLNLTCRSLSFKMQLEGILYYPILVRLFMDGCSNHANNF